MPGSVASCFADVGFLTAAEERNTLVVFDGQQFVAG